MQAIELTEDTVNTITSKVPAGRAELTEQAKGRGKKFVVTGTTDKFGHTVMTKSELDKQFDYDEDADQSQFFTVHRK